MINGLWNHVAKLFIYFVKITWLSLHIKLCFFSVKKFEPMIISVGYIQWVSNIHSLFNSTIVVNHCNMKITFFLAA